MAALIAIHSQRNEALEAMSPIATALTTQPATDISTGQTTRIDKTPGNADKSLVLIKPLLDNNTVIHPVKLFSSTTDARYHTIYRWVVNGFPGPL